MLGNHPYGTVHKRNLNTKPRHRYPDPRVEAGPITVRFAQPLADPLTPEDRRRIAIFGGIRPARG